MSKKMTEYSDEIKFCVKYLLEHGVNVKEFMKVVFSLGGTMRKFELVPVKPSRKDFYTELAEKMRELWPSGDKDGKYAWRDSVPNLAHRLECLWSDRLKGKEYTLEQCLTVARRYLAQFEDNTKYMQTLKYFIMKQATMKKGNANKVVVSSRFADMLEGIADDEAAQNEWDELVNSASVGEGEII